MPQKPKIALITTGGTIASVASADHEGAAMPLLTGDTLVKMSPELLEIVDIDVINLFSKASTSLTLKDLSKLKNKILEVQNEYDGVVITHGTDVMEETAFVLSVSLDIEIPVVITGALRRPDLPGADGPQNLISACQVAASKKSKNMGVMVVMNGEIMSGLFVKKTHSFKPQAFSNNPIGWIAEDRVRLFLKPNIEKPTLEIGTRNSKVLIVECGFNTVPEEISTIDYSKLDALIFNITGVGHISEDVAEYFKEIASKIPTFFASRTGDGETFLSYYGYIGSEKDLIEKGLIPAGFLSARQLRMLLLLAFSSGQKSNKDIQKLISSFG